MRILTLVFLLCAGLALPGTAQRTVTIKHTYYTNTFDTVQYWKVISYTKNGKTMQEAWLGPNKPGNRSTDPNAISSTASDVKRVILQYYPKFSFDF